MLNLQPFGQYADCRDVVIGQRLDHEQRLMLMRLDAGGARGLFAEIQEAANFVAKVGECEVVNLSARSVCHRRKYIVIRYYLTVGLRVCGNLNWGDCFLNLSK